MIRMVLSILMLSVVFASPISGQEKHEIHSGFAGARGGAHLRGHGELPIRGQHGECESAAILRPGIGTQSRLQLEVFPWPRG